MYAFSYTVYGYGLNSKRLSDSNAKQPFTKKECSQNLSYQTEFLCGNPLYCLYLNDVSPSF